jgi:uncharacterized protein (DUF924 family)
MMQMSLDTEERCAHWVRKADPWLPDNIVEDELARLRYLETGKMIVSDVQFTRMALRSFAKLSADEKRQAREKTRWSIYDRKLRPTIN